MPSGLTRLQPSQCPSQTTKESHLSTWCHTLSLCGDMASPQPSTQHLGRQPCSLVTASLSHTVTLWCTSLFALRVCLCRVGDHNPQAPVTNGFWPGGPVGSTGGRCRGISVGGGCCRGLSSSCGLLGPTTCQGAESGARSAAPSSRPSTQRGRPLPAVAQLSSSLSSLLFLSCVTTIPILILFVWNT